MNRLLWVALLVLVLVGCLSYHLLPPSAQASSSPSVVGRLLDALGVPVHDAEVRAYLNRGEEPVAVEESQGDGSFIIDLPEGPVVTVELEIERPHFESTTWTAGPDELARLRQGETVRVRDITMERRITPGFWMASLAFVVMLVLIALENVHNTMAALLGVAIVLGVSFVGPLVNPNIFILDFETALQYVDFDVIFLVTGMMIVVGILETTGIFQWMAYQAYRFSLGRAWLLVTILLVITSVASAMLDNVTTMLLMTPMTLEIALVLGIDPLCVILPEVLASNIGGITTLVGTPTNILIGSYADIGSAISSSTLRPA